MNIGPAVATSSIDGLTRRRLERDAQMAADVRNRVETAVTIHGITAVLKALSEHCEVYSQHLKGRGDIQGAIAWAGIKGHTSHAYVYANEHLAD